MPSSSRPAHPQSRRTGFVWRRGRTLAGTASALAIAALIALLLWALWTAGQAFPGRASGTLDIVHLVRMSAIQAGLSTVLSLMVGLVLAWTLDRLHFTGRGLVVGLFSSALVLPALVIVSGLVAIWGRNGLVNIVLAPFGTSTGASIYGLGGIVAAHVLLNGAFAGRLLLDRLEAIPPAKLKLGRSLGLDAGRRVLAIDLPALAASLPGIAATVFLLCFTSFAIVLILGGGPTNQTLEVAIYESVRLDFNLSDAVRLALVQLLVSAAIIIPASTLAPGAALFGGRSHAPWPDRGLARGFQIILLGAILVGFVAPLLAVLARGTVSAVGAVVSRPAFWQATGTSLAIGLVSAGLCIALALALAMARALAHQRRWLRTALGFPVFAYLAVPAVVLSLGFFLLARFLGVPTGLAAPVVLVIANALLALPFVFATLAPPLEALLARNTRLIRALGLSGWDQWRLVEWPLLGRALGYCAAVAFVFSLGDLGVISLFGTEDFSTLPWLMYRSFGAYRTQDAEAIAALLLILSVAAFIGIPKLFEAVTHARN